MRATFVPQLVLLIFAGLVEGVPSRDKKLVSSTLPTGPIFPVKLEFKRENPKIGLNTYGNIELAYS